MDRAGSILDGIDVERIDADVSNAGVDELFGEFAGKMRMAFEILVGAPVRVPAGVNEECFSLESRKVDGQAIDGAVVAIDDAGNDTIQIGQRFEFQLREIIAVRVAMAGAVE